MKRLVKVCIANQHYIVLQRYAVGNAIYLVIHLNALVMTLRYFITHVKLVGVLLVGWREHCREHASSLILGIIMGTFGCPHIRGLSTKP